MCTRSSLRNRASANGVDPTSISCPKMTYKVALYKTEEGYAVSCPGLPGCWSEGPTETEALANISDAITE
jgi:hypothetical protein